MGIGPFSRRGSVPAFLGEREGVFFADSALLKQGHRFVFRLQVELIDSDSSKG
jgi:hypothetical protein